MNNKKLYVSMLILTVAFLIFMYVLKIWFPQEFVMAIENDKIIKIGEYIDNYQWLYYICCAIPAFITYWLYLCAVSHRLYLKWYECLYILFTIIISIILSIYDLILYEIFNWCSFVILPTICKGYMKSCGIVFTVHSISQGLSLRIRNLCLYFTNSINFLSGLLMTLECYLWLILLYIIFNFKKENSKMGIMCPPVYGKSKFYEKKKAKAEKKISKLQEVIKVCDEQLAKENK